MEPTNQLFALLQTHHEAEQPLDTLLAKVDRLLEEGADLGAEDSFGRRPLQVACERRITPRLIEHLLAKGADVADLGRQDRHGSTPIHRAALQRCEDDLRHLLRVGADPNALNHLQQTPVGVVQREMQQRRWVVEHLGGSSPDEEQALVVRWERAIVLLREAGGEERRAGWQPLIDDDAARGVGPTDPELALSGNPLDSLEELALWMKEHEVRPEKVTPLLCSSAAARAMNEQGDAGALAFFHHGDLRVQGHLHVASAFVVTGDLVVEGVLSDGGPDSCLMVGGSLNAHAVHTDGDVHVSGDVVASVVYGSYNDHVLEAQVLRCRALIIDDHLFRAERVSELVVELREGYDRLECARVFTPEVLKVGGDLDIEALFDRLYSGEDVFAKEGQQPDPPPVLSLEEFETWLNTKGVSQRTKLALIKAHWTPTLRAADLVAVKRLLQRALKSPKLKDDLQAYLASLAEP